MNNDNESPGFCKHCFEMINLKDSGAHECSYHYTMFPEENNKKNLHKVDLFYWISFVGFMIVNSVFQTHFHYSVYEIIISSIGLALFLTRILK